jgi:hypothetical protein
LVGRRCQWANGRERKNSTHRPNRAGTKCGRRERREYKIFSSILLESRFFVMVVMVVAFAGGLGGGRGERRQAENGEHG